MVKLSYRASEALEKAAQHPNAEVASRARRALEKINAYTHIVLDGTGKPIAGGRLEVTIRGEVPVVPSAGPTLTDPALFGRTDGVVVPLVPDARGHVTVPRSPLGRTRVPARFSHSEYGSMQGMIDLADPKQRFLVPLVKRGTPAYERAFKGVVLGPDGKPVNGAVVTFAEIRTPGDGLIASDSSAAAMSDDKGRFAFYPLFSSSGGAAEPALVPAKSKAFVSVSTPADGNLFPYAGEHVNTAEARIQLERPKQFHTFQFEQRGGDFVKDSRQLGQMWIAYSKTDGGRGVQLKPQALIEGAKLLPGFYRAGMHNATYLPLEVKNDSPEELIFRRRPAITLRGKIVDGLTGKPMAKAFVFGYQSTALQTLAILTADDWKALRAMPENSPLNHPALAVVTKIYGLASVNRTDDEGRYELVQEPEDNIYGLIAVEENYLPYEQTKQSLKFDERHIAEVPDLPLFPAAKVLIKPVVKAARASIMPLWHFEKDAEPKWVSRLGDAMSASRSFQYAHWMKINELQPIYVPSGVSLRIQLFSPYAEEFSRTLLPKLIYLNQGETLTIGEVEVQAAIRLDIDVLDGKGAPQEGIVVRRYDEEENALGLPHSTDAKGKTSFFVDRHSSGRFRVDIASPPDSNVAKNLLLPFKVSDSAPDLKSYKFTLTDEQVKSLRGH